MKKLIICLLLIACTDHKEIPEIKVIEEVNSLIERNREKIREVEIRESTEKNQSNNVKSKIETKIEEDVSVSQVNTLNDNTVSGYNSCHDDAVTFLINGDLNAALVKINEAIKINPIMPNSYYIRVFIRKKEILKELLKIF